MWYVFIIIGLLAGVIGGMGMGGGTILIPLLTIFTATTQIFAQGYNLLAFLPMAIIAIIFHFKNKLIKFDGFFYIIVPGIVFCVLSSFVSNYIGGEIVKIIFGVFLILLSVLEFIKIFKKL